MPKSNVVKVDAVNDDITGLLKLESGRLHFKLSHKHMINRSAVIVRPRQPYIDWAKGLDDSGMDPSEVGCLLYTSPSPRDS